MKFGDLMEEDMTKEDAIKFFRKFIAKREGLSEEDAGAKINKSVEMATELFEPLWAIQTAISKRASISFSEAVKMAMAVITALIYPFPAEVQKSMLMDIVLKDVGNSEKSEKLLREELEKYIGENKKR